MYYPDLFAPGRARTAVLLLALFAIFVLWLQTRTSPAPTITAWNGPMAASQSMMNSLRAEAKPQVLAFAIEPSVNPLHSDKLVMTQGYGVGSHAPAAIWGGVDLAIDANGDGQAEPETTMGMPIYATISGVARVVPNSWPGGNYVSISNDHYKVAYAHLSSFAVEHGQQVAAGQVIGYVGTTGSSSGPHLHYEVYKDGVNVNPLDFGALTK